MTLMVGNKSITKEYIVHVRGVTFEEFLEFANEDISCELLNGVLVIHSPASYRHQTISRFLLTFLDQIGLQQKIGRALGAPFIVKLDPNWAPEPDIIFYRSLMEEAIKDTFFDGIPDIIVEILSPSNRQDDLNTKLPKYLALGIPEVWIIDPDEKTLTIHHAGQDPNMYSNPESMVKSKIFPEIHFRLKWLWDKDMNPIEAVKQISKVKKKI